MNFGILVLITLIGTGWIDNEIKDLITYQVNSKRIQLKYGRIPNDLRNITLVDLGKRMKKLATWFWLNLFLGFLIFPAVKFLSRNVKYAKGLKRAAICNKSKTLEKINYQRAIQA